MSKILVVDDNEDMCNVISDALEEEGCAVTTTHDGADAMEKVMHGHYDSVVLDYRLYDESGLELLSDEQRRRTVSK